MEERAKAHPQPERPPLDQSADAPPLQPSQLEHWAEELGSPSALTRTQAANRLQQARGEGVAACLRKIDSAADPVVARVLDFLAVLDLHDVAPEHLEPARSAAARRLKSASEAVRVAAACMLCAAGPGSARTDFLGAITDGARKVRWAVVRRFSDHPDELENAQLMLLASYLGDTKLGAAVRADVHTLLLAAHDAFSRGQRPESYDPYADVSSQRSAIVGWESWARTVVIVPAPR